MKLLFFVLGLLLPLAGCSTPEEKVSVTVPTAGLKPADKPKKIDGSGVVFVRTDSNGRVVEARMVEPIHPLIDSTIEARAREEWRGPPGQTKYVPVTYTLAE